MAGLLNPAASRPPVPPVPTRAMRAKPRPPFDCRDALAALASGDRPVPRRVFDLRLRAVLHHAVRVDPPAALRALWAFVLGKRVRGWNALCTLANRHPDWSAHWRAGHRRALIAGLRRLVADRGLAPVKVAAVVAGGMADTAAAAHTRRNLRQVLGSSLVLVVADDLSGVPGQASGALAAADWEWLLVLRAGDTIDPAFGAIPPLLSADTGGRSAWFWDCDGDPASGPLIKPDWDPVLDRSVDLLAGALVVSRDVLAATQRQVADNADATTLVAALAATVRRSADEPGHLPALLGALSSVSVPSVPVSSVPVRAVAPLALQRGPLPSVSIIVLTRDRSDLVIPLLAALDRIAYGGRIERIVVDNGSTEPRLLDFLRDQQARGALRCLHRPGPFNFAALNNQAVAEAGGELLCLLNNDIEPVDAQWLSRMVAAACDPGTGAVGAMLTYPDGTIQHAGVALGVGGAAGHVQRCVDPDASRMANWHAMSRRVEAVTAACMVVRRDLFEAVGGFDAALFPVAFNDVDFCLRLRAAGLHNVYIAEAQLVHHESLSRGADHQPENLARFAAELGALRDRWQTERYHDRNWSPLFSRTSEQCLLVP